MATSSTTQTLNGLFRDIYSQKIVDQATNKLWRGEEYVGVVHPLTFKSLQNAVNTLKETKMPYLDEPTNEEKSDLSRALEHHTTTVRNLRRTITSKQEELRIHLALLKTLKKLQGGK